MVLFKKFLLSFTLWTLSPHFGGIGAIKKSICFQKKGHANPCRVAGMPYMLIFGIVQIILSQLTNVHQPSWLSMTSAAMSVTYSTVGLGLSLSKIAVNGKIKGSLTGIISTRKLTEIQKLRRVSQALGSIAFAYSLVIIEIQETIKSSPAEHKTMQKTTLISVATTTVFYMFCGCFGYAAFGDMAPGNLLTGFGFYNPYWLIDIANGAIIIHLVGAYQVYCQPLFAFVENTAAKYFPESKFINNNIDIPIPFGGFEPYKLNIFKIVWRTVFVCITTIASIMFIPYYNDVVGILGPFGFYPLAVYFPVKMYIVQKKIHKWSSRWILLQIISIACLIILLFAAVGSVVGAVDLKLDKPFKIVY